TDDFPNIKDNYKIWFEQLESKISAPNIEKIKALIDNIPDKNTYLHGNLNLTNIAVVNDELYLLDMAGSSYGHAIFDLQVLYESLVKHEKEHPGYCSSTIGLSADSCAQFWDLFFSVYIRGQDSSARKKLLNLLEQYYILNQQLLSLI
nr:hypothetical protein [Lachnospiraceae bacterium]